MKISDKFLFEGVSPSVNHAVDTSPIKHSLMYRGRQVLLVLIVYKAIAKIVNFVWICVFS